MGRIHRHGFDLLQNLLGVSVRAFRWEASIIAIFLVQFVCTYVRRKMTKAFFASSNPNLFLST